jgi:hypothetical protein
MKYKMVQIPEDAYNLLKQHCKNNDLKIGAFVATLIKKNVIIKQLPENILKVQK